MSSVAPTRAAVLARTLREAGIKRMFGLPGGEVLELIHAAKGEGIEFLLTRHEAAHRSWRTIARHLSP
jgi:acetolactate synthase I/II/III large subunit